MKLTFYLFLLSNLILTNNIKGDDYLKIENCEIAKKNFIKKSDNPEERIKMLDKINCWKIKTEQDRIDDKLIADMNNNWKGWFLFDWPIGGQMLYVSLYLYFIFVFVKNL
jgi:hypothetical protein